MKKFKLVTFLMAVIICVSATAGCSSVDVSEILTVNNVKVTGGEVRFYLSVMKNMIAGELGKSSASEVNWETDEIEGKKALDVAKQRTYDDIVENKLAAEEAKNRKLSITSDERNEVRNSILTYFGGKSKDDVLKECELSDEVFNSIIEDLTYAQKLSEDIYTNSISSQEITDDEMRAKYDSELEQAAAGGYVRAKHILIMFNKEDGTSRTEQEALDEANRIRAMITDDNFDSLMEQYSEDPGIKSQPDGYTFVHGDGTYVKEFDDAAYSLEIGQVSEPVKTSYGYHIIKRVKVIDEFESEDMQADLRSAIQNERLSAAYDELIESLKEKATIVKNDDKYNKIK